jgi:hypothetical protein
MSEPFDFDTRAVRAGTLRSEFHEHSEALFLTSSFVFDSAAQAAARFSGEDETGGGKVAQAGNVVCVEVGEDDGADFGGLDVGRQLRRLRHPCVVPHRRRRQDRVVGQPV